jgi:hypothetical protein
MSFGTQPIVIFLTINDIPRHSATINIPTRKNNVTPPYRALKNESCARFWGWCALVFLGAGTAGAWDYSSHSVINQLALASLPTNFPAFVLAPAQRERIAFLSGEPDRWRSNPGLSLRNANGPDHYIDLEELKLCDLTPDQLPPLRYTFAALFAQARAAHPERFEAINPEMDQDQTRELTGFLPWTIVEYTDKLESCFSYLKTFERAGGTPAEIANAQADVVYVMGVMGHFVGDGSQPLHTTIHFNGWVGDNPHGYTTNRTFHAWIDGGYFRKTGEPKLETLAGKIHPAESVGEEGRPDGLFRAVVAYLVDQNELVETLYQLEKEGKLFGEGEQGLAGRPFLEGQLIKGGQMLGNIWWTAWLHAPEDFYLRGQLEQRSARNSSAPAK